MGNVLIDYLCRTVAPVTQQLETFASDKVIDVSLPQTFTTTS